MSEEATGRATGELARQLHAFAGHLRDPEGAPAPEGVDDRRMAVYRELFLNNVRSLLGSGFPVIREALGETRWNALARGFLRGYRSQTPLFTEVGSEFVRFLERRQAEAAGDPPWLAELAHYEWIELALQIADAPLPPHDAGGDLLTGVPLRSPLAWPLAYRWPVQAIGPGHAPDVPPDSPSLLLVRRDAGGEIRFSALSPLVYRLLQLLDADPPLCGRDALARLADEAQADDLDAFLRDGTAMLRRLREEGTVLGTRPETQHPAG